MFFQSITQLRKWLKKRRNLNSDNSEKHIKITKTLAKTTKQKFALMKLSA